MTKKSELWIAAGGDELTASLSLYQDGSHPRIRIVLSGTVMSHNRYITNALLVSMGSVDYACAEIDVRGVAFCDGNHVNPLAVECLLLLVMAVVQDDRTAILSIADGCVGEVLEDVLGRMKTFQDSVIIEADEPVAAPRRAMAARSPGGLALAAVGRVSAALRRQAPPSLLAEAAGHA
jgi:hypothetical protein